ncbi:MAG: ribonuclease PH [Candidatus Babeliales bacterium]
MVRQEDVFRNDGRKNNQMREIRVTVDPYGYADASVLCEYGKTKVLCSVTLQAGVPPFLRGNNGGMGWLTAEYALLPCATQVRARRDGVQNRRSMEISRLIGRSLRAAVQLEKLGNRTIVVDCDVLQADGGTRAASITGASLALCIAVDRWLQRGDIVTSIIRDYICAVSVGALHQTVLLDVHYEEDSIVDADFTFVLNQCGDIIELQGTGERAAVSWDLFDQMKRSVQEGHGLLCGYYEDVLKKYAPLLYENEYKKQYATPRL